MYAFRHLNWRHKGLTGVPLQSDNVVDQLELNPPAVQDFEQILVNLPSYADNAAAITGGLDAGDFYINSSTKVVTQVS